MSTAVAEPGAPTSGPRRRNPFVLAAILVAVAFIVFMWIYAFFFATDEGINRIGDRAWSAEAETICAAANEQRSALADYRTLDQVGTDALAERAEIVEQANTILATMLDELEQRPPNDAKGQRIIPTWLADWRTYLGNRIEYVADLRAGDGSGFAETEIDGSPISNFIGDVARQNEMPSCQVPLDLAN